MYFLYSLGGVTFNKCWITLSILNCYSPNFQGFILMKNALNNQVGMLGDMFLWLVANLKQGVIYFIKQALPPNKSAGSVQYNNHSWLKTAALNSHLHGLMIENSNFLFWKISISAENTIFVTYWSLNHVGDKWKKIIQFGKK